jgi:hypothetical protein
MVVVPVCKWCQVLDHAYGYKPLSYDQDHLRLGLDAHPVPLFSDFDELMITVIVFFFSGFRSHWFFVSLLLPPLTTISHLISLYLLNDSLLFWLRVSRFKFVPCVPDASGCFSITTTMSISTLRFPSSNVDSIPVSNPIGNGSVRSQCQSDVPMCSKLL